MKNPKFRIQRKVGNNSDLAFGKCINSSKFYAFILGARFTVPFGQGRGTARDELRVLAEDSGWHGSGWPHPTEARSQGQHAGHQVCVRF